MRKKKEFRLDKVAVRLVKEPPLYSDTPVSTPEAAVKLLGDMLKDYDREVLAVVMLQVDLKPIAVSVVSMGTLNEALAHPREILKPIILANAGSVMLVHNHVSGSLKPSVEDVQLTDRMQKVCNLLGTPVIDHVIIGRGDQFYSFQEKGVLPMGKIVYAEREEELQLERPSVAQRRSVIEGLSAGSKNANGKAMVKHEKLTKDACL